MMPDADVSTDFPIPIFISIIFNELTQTDYYSFRVSERESVSTSNVHSHRFV